jgi:hypothetical protein
VEKYSRAGRPQMTIWRMRISCQITKAKNTHTHTHTHTNTHTHTQTHTHKHTHTNTYIHTNTHTHKHTHTQTHTHTLTINNTHCFSTATMVERTRHSVTFIRTFSALLILHTCQFFSCYASVPSAPYQSCQYTL